jgi:hypothetical protein
MSSPSSAVSVSQIQPRTLAAAAAERISGSSPHERSSSMDHVLMPFARGRGEGCGRRSASTKSIPWFASVIAAVSPAGPPPTISTDASLSVI